jgi:hypothetical protein
MKSMLISVHFCDGIGRGLRRPGYLTFSVLEIWQVGHSLLPGLLWIVSDEASRKLVEFYEE